MLYHASALLSSLKPCTCTDKGRFGGGGGSSTGVLSICLALCVILMCMYACCYINFSKDYLIEKY